MVRNIAEGGGRWSQADSASRYKPSTRGNDERQALVRLGFAEASPSRSVEVHDHDYDAHVGP